MLLLSVERVKDLIAQIFKNPRGMGFL